MTAVRGLTLIAAGALVLSACAPVPSQGFRDTELPMGASTRYDSAAFAGDWIIVARFGAPAGGTIRFLPASERLKVLSDGAPQVVGQYNDKAGAPGQLVPVTADLEPLVVMWVDADFETAAIGTPSGSFGAVIDRDGLMPADRAKAARDILDFYGWDTAALQRIDV